MQADCEGTYGPGLGESSTVPLPLSMPFYSSSAPDFFVKSQIGALQNRRGRSASKPKVPPLKDKLENVLNESRILMLGVQVLIGFDLRAVFEDRFAAMPVGLQHLKLLSLALLIAAVALLMSPLAFHRIRVRDEGHQALHDFSQRVIECALLPFALAIGLDVMLASERIVSSAISFALGAATLMLAMLFWYGLGYFKRREHAMDIKPAERSPLDLKDKIKEALVEARIALPGVQATLGFQFIIVLATGFDALPQSLREIHLASLLCSALCAVLLIAPAAYHRIALNGEDSEEFLHFVGKMVLAALVPLALALAGDVAVVTWKITQSWVLALLLAAGTLLVTLGFWFGYMLWRRRRFALQPAPHRIDARLDHVK